MIKFKNVISSTIIFCALLSGYAVADSDIYITNSTCTPLFINIVHSGTALLKKNDEWFQHANEIDAFETMMKERFMYGEKEDPIFKSKMDQSINAWIKEQYLIKCRINNNFREPKTK